jgi:D-methionine transport system substrate-binding protein
LFICPSSRSENKEEERIMKNTIRTALTAALALTLAGCSASSAAASSASGTSDDKTITVGATSVPHAEILQNVVADVLKDEGYTLEVTVFNDYVQPNTAVEEGELDANYFQTLGYMEGENKDRDLHLKAVAGVHIEPMGFYSKTLTDIADIKDGASIAVPNDSDNEDRALQFLVDSGLLVDPNKDGDLTDTDFNGNATTNPHNYDIQIAEAASLPQFLDDVDGAVINGNYALEASLPDSYPALKVETFDDKTTIARTNFVVCKEGNEDTAKIKALVKAVQSDEVKKYIEDNYKGSVIASFIDPSTISD